MIDFNNYITWNALLPLINEDNTSDQIVISSTHSGHYGLKRESKHLPVSLNEREFNLFIRFIRENNLTCGYELGTGFGISTLAIGIGMQYTKGIVYTLDSYVEGEYQYQPVGNTSDKITPVYPQDMKFAIETIKKFGVRNYVVFLKGNSPEYALNTFDSYQPKLDFVFLDCPKVAQDLYRDIHGFKPYLSDKYALFIHDTHDYQTEAKKIVKEELDIELKFDILQQKFPLASAFKNI